MQPKYKVGELCGFNADEAKVQMSDKLVVLDLRHAVGRIEKFLGYGYEVYVRYKGEDFTLCFPECMLHAVEDTYLNRLKVSYQSAIVATGTDMYFKFADGSMYGMDGNRKDPSGDQAKRPDHIVFCGGRNHGKSWLQEFDKWNERIKESLLNPKRYILTVDLGKVYAKMPESVSKPESKMPKHRCIKLLESYRAEREKVAKGRKFERCLRDDVVNEALEKAIELLKNG